MGKFLIWFFYIRSLQLKHTIHSYDIQQAVNYCDNDTACDVELSTFVKSVCPHFPSDMETGFIYYLVGG